MIPTLWMMLLQLTGWTMLAFLANEDWRLAAAAHFSLVLAQLWQRSIVLGWSFLFVGGLSRHV
jgi:hypothetical protein